MAKNMKLRTKLVIIGVLFTTIPLIIVSVIVVKQNKKLIGISSEGSMVMAFADLDHIAHSMYALCETQQEVIQDNVDHSLNVARDTLLSKGDVCEANETVVWNAVNQYTKSASRVELPKMMVGDTWLGQNTNISKTSPIVDKVQNLVSGTCTIFQRMNNSGDMLRVCTNVKKIDGTRAIGTFIPSTNPDGQSNPVTSAVLNGQTFRGRAYVVNKWYITAYEPIYDAGKKIIGMLYVGIPQESVASLRQAIMDTQVGKTGYVYVLDSKGHYVISSDGKRDGEDIWEAKDDDGTYFIQEICKKAVKLRPGEMAEQKYPWKNAGDAKARMKIVRIVYFEPWDWVIGVGSYEEEFFEERNEVIARVTAICQTSNVALGIALSITLAGTVIVWFLVARGIAGKINRVTVQLTEGSEQVYSASGQVSSASQSLAEGSTEQAAGLEETSSSLEEMASMTKQNADNAQQANTLAAEARKAADTGTEAMRRMNVAINEIQKSSDETAKIIKVIDEIAFQTNLLALNAAVEAARAGEAGKGFAVVAEEVRNLAMRSAEAAKNTANIIEESVKNSKNGVDIANEVGKVLEEIVQGIGKTTDLVSEIAAASQEQAQGIDQVNNAMAQMDKVTQQNAANAEESASASEELTSQAESMNLMVNELVALVGGSGASVTNLQKTKNSGYNQHKNAKPQRDNILGKAKEVFGKQDKLPQSDQTFHKIANGRNKKEPQTATKHSAGKFDAEKTIPLNDNENSEYDDFKKFNS